MFAPASLGCRHQPTPWPASTTPLVVQVLLAAVQARKMTAASSARRGNARGARARARRDRRRDRGHRAPTAGTPIDSRARSEPTCALARTPLSSRTRTARIPRTMSVPDASPSDAIEPAARACRALCAARQGTDGPCRSRTSPRDPNSIHKRRRYWLRKFGETRDCFTVTAVAFPRDAVSRLATRATKTPRDPNETVEKPP